MSLESKNSVLASDFVDLKARVKAEMARRTYQQPLNSYAGTEYDYTTVPAAGGVIKTEHVNKLITPINAIAPSGYTEASSGDPVAALKALNDFFASHEGKAFYNTVDCANGCSGLCRGYCSNTCSGCSGCSGCGDSCSTSCSGGCSGSCGGACWRDGCTSNCTAACRMDCTGSCSGSCSGGCMANCSKTCVTGCTGGCGTQARMTT